MVDFICMGLNRPVRIVNRELQNENSCPQWDSNPGPSAYEANSLNVALLVEISIEHLNVDRVLKWTCIVYHVVDVVKCFVVYYILLTRSANVLISQTAKRYKYFMTKIHEKSFCYIHVLQVIQTENSGKTRSTFKCSIDISTYSVVLSEFASDAEGPGFKSHWSLEFFIL